MKWLIKIITKIKNMFNENNIAAAQIAQIFGSELLKVQQSTTSEGANATDIVRLNPKSFLVGESNFNAARKREEQMLIRNLQAQAEAAHPLPPSSSTSDPQETLSPQKPFNPVIAPSSSVATQPRAVYAGGEVYLERIAISLEKLVTLLEKKPKKSASSKRKRKTNTNEN